MQGPEQEDRSIPSDRNDPAYSSFTAIERYNGEIKLTPIEYQWESGLAKIMLYASINCRPLSVEEAKQLITLSDDLPDTDLNLVRKKLLCYLLELLNLGQTSIDPTIEELNQDLEKIRSSLIPIIHATELYQVNQLSAHAEWLAAITSMIKFDQEGTVDRLEEVRKKYDSLLYTKVNPLSLQLQNLLQGYLLPLSLQSLAVNCGDHEREKASLSESVLHLNTARSKQGELSIEQAAIHGTALDHLGLRDLALKEFAYGFKKAVEEQRLPLYPVIAPLLEDCIERRELEEAYPYYKAGVRILQNNLAPRSLTLQLAPKLMLIATFLEDRDSLLAIQLDYINCILKLMPEQVARERGLKEILPAMVQGGGFSQAELGLRRLWQEIEVSPVLYNDSSVRSEIRTALAIATCKTGDFSTAEPIAIEELESMKEPQTITEAERYHNLTFALFSIATLRKDPETALEIVDRSKEVLSPFFEDEPYLERSVSFRTIIALQFADLYEESYKILDEQYQRLRSGEMSDPLLSVDILNLMAEREIDEGGSLLAAMEYVGESLDICQTNNLGPYYTSVSTVIHVGIVVERHQRGDEKNSDLVSTTIEDGITLLYECGLTESYEMIQLLRAKLLFYETMGYKKASEKLSREIAEIEERIVPYDPKSFGL